MRIINAQYGMVKVNKIRGYKIYQILDNIKVKRSYGTVEERELRGSAKNVYKQNTLLCNRIFNQ